MPTVMQIGRYRFFFYSNESQEPAHIRAGEDEAKFWLEPVLLASNHGFRARDLNDIERLVSLHRAEFVEAWNDYFDEPQAKD